MVSSCIILGIKRQFFWTISYYKYLIDCIFGNTWIFKSSMSGITLKVLNLGLHTLLGEFSSKLHSLILRSSRFLSCTNVSNKLVLWHIEHNNNYEWWFVTLIFVLHTNFHEKSKRFWFLGLHWWIHIAQLFGCYN